MNSPDDLRLLIKLLSMTASANDSEALTAVRKANEHVTVKLETTWEDILRAKVTIVENPFENLPEPPVNGSQQPQTSPPRAPWEEDQDILNYALADDPFIKARSFHQRYGATPEELANRYGGAFGAQPAPPPKNAQGQMLNKYAGHCRKCRARVGVHAGFLVGKKGAWEVECQKCH